MAVRVEGQVLQFAQEWTIGERIGTGGFGQVYSAMSASGQSAAAKFVRKAPQAERELLFVNLDGVPNVVPVLDSGEHQEQWVLVMPLAERSLRDLLDEEPVPALDTTLAILIDIADALAGLDGKVVHRDLKPENVLLVAGRWCVADFGISRYADASTGTHTSKFSLSMPYAGPERWRLEHAEPSTDIYSFGVMAWEMLMGRRPFVGPGEADFRSQHLHEDPPGLTAGSVPLQSLVAECLYKLPGTRPRAANVAARLVAVRSKPASGAFAALQAANHEQVQLEAARTRRDSAAQTAEEERRGLYKAAGASMKAICAQLAATIEENAPQAGVSFANGGGIKVGLGDGFLEIGGFAEAVSGALAPWSPIRVIATATMSVGHLGDQYGYHGRSHSLWYCDAANEGEYAWYETAFMDHPFVMGGGDESILPYALPPGSRAGGAMGTGMNVTQLAWPFTVVRPSDLDSWQERWIGWFAAAANRNLHRPASMPERQTQGSYRK